MNILYNILYNYIYHISYIYITPFTAPKEPGSPVAGTRAPLWDLDTRTPLDSPTYT